jgi:hypothetical protein
MYLKSDPMVDELLVEVKKSKAPIESSKQHCNDIGVGFLVTSKIIFT